MYSYLIVFLLAIIVLVVIRKNKFYTDNNYPPGPLCLPLIGSVWAMGINTTHMHASLFALAKKWGPVYRLQIGNYPIIVVTDPEVIKETFDSVNSPAFLRFASITFTQFCKGLSTIFPTNRKYWIESRRIHSHSMRNLPGGPTKPEVILGEIPVLLAELDNHVGKGVHMNPLFLIFTRNIFFQIALSRSWGFEKLDGHEQRYAISMDDYIEGISSIFDYFPSLQFMRSKSTLRVLGSSISMDKYLKSVIDERKKYPLPTDETVKDFLDWALLEQKRNPNYTEASLLQNTTELVFASSFTTSDTLDWAVLFLCEYPDIQEKCFKEISEKLKGRKPTMEDQPNLPYLDAFLKETARLRPAIPLGVPHLTDQECTIGGYRIDKGSIVVKNLYGIGNSERYFEKASEFDPERYIRNPELLANLQFGYGPNSCLGAPLAKQEIFLTTVSLIQRYQLKYDLSSPAPDINGEFKIAFNPSKWYTVLSLR